MEQMSILDNLNKEQRAPAEETNYPVLVTAGAGSGKTRMLTHRIAYLVKEKQIRPENILAITFTNKAANEMKQRLETMIDGVKDMWVCTFHAMCARILRADADKIGYTRSFSIYSDSERDKLIKKAIEETQTTLNLETISYHISNAKNHLLKPDEYGEFITVRAKRDDIISCYKIYESELKKCNAFDFDDLIEKTFYLLRENPQTLEFYQNKFQYIHVDEFQDTNTVQYELVKLLGGKRMNVFAVGDEDQCIYSWRGAEVENVFSFSKDFPNAKVFKLEQNYRSTKNILKIANKLIKRNVNRLDKNLWTDKDGGAQIEEYTTYNESEEAEYVASTIKSLTAYSGYRYSDFAVLMRVNSQSRAVEEKMITYGVPYKVYGGFKFFERKEIKDVISYLRLLVNPFDNEAVRKVLAFPKKGIGDVSIANIEATAELASSSMFDVVMDEKYDVGKVRSKLGVVTSLYSDLLSKKDNMGLYDLVSYTIEKAGIKEAFSTESDEDISRRMNVDDFLVSVKEFEDSNSGASLEEYLGSITLYRDIDSMDDEDDTVSLITVHAAKGLEFKVVFIIGLNENLFPLSRAINSDDENQLEEERRLMYVAITRAKERLYMTRPRTKFSFETKRTDYTVPSRFLRECKNDQDLQDVGFSNKSNDRYSNSYMGSSEEYYGRDRESSLETRMASKVNVVNISKTNTFENKPQEKSMASSLTGVPKSEYHKYTRGTRVSHPHFGEGEVTLPVTDANSGFLTVKFDSVGNKTLSLKYANLKIIS